VGKDGGQGRKTDVTNDRTYSIAGKSDRCPVTFCSCDLFFFLNSDDYQLYLRLQIRPAEARLRCFAAMAGKAKFSRAAENGEDDV